MRNYEYNYINIIRGNVVPDAHKKHYGSYMSFDDKPISPGCVACKSGGDCVIVEDIPSVTNIISGEIYSIQTDNYLFIEIVKGNETDKELILKAINDKDYPEIIIQKKDIINIGRAFGIVSKL